MARFLLVAFFGLATQAQDIQGVVHDSQGRTFVGLTVTLKDAAQALTVKTDAGGRYHFAGLHRGSYTLLAGDSVVGPFDLGSKETKKIDLTCTPAALPEFFDPPKFTVAGVTDSTNRGGHGSDVVLRSSEALSKATATLGGSLEKSHDPVDDVRKYQLDAERDPTEPNLFRLGAELLLHRAAEQATEVFAKGSRLFPRSSRMLMGLAAAWYASGVYDQAARCFFDATDVDPSDPGPYLFLGKVRSVEITGTDGYLERMKRFVKLRPGNALANYYYGTAVWNRTKDAAQAQPALEKSVRLDPNLGEAHLELGILYDERPDLARAIAAYRRAISASPKLEEAHYRLAQAYRRAGDDEKARDEFALHDKLSKEAANQAESERSKVQRFVIQLQP
jgi:tetratricopeptide (TPR) repeat protein